VCFFFSFSHARQEDECVGGAKNKEQKPRSVRQRESKGQEIRTRRDKEFGGEKKKPNS